MQRMSKKEGFAWVSATLGISSLAIGSIGAIIGLIAGNSVGVALMFTIAWVGAFYAIALYRGNTLKQEYKVVERMRKVYDVKFGGLRLIFPFIDVVRAQGSLYGANVELFVDNDDEQKQRVAVDFADGTSAPVHASGWYQIGDPRWLSAKSRWAMEAMEICVLRFTYLVQDKDRVERITEIFESALLPMLQSRAFDDAKKDSDAIATDATKIAAAHLQQLGIFPAAGKGIVIRDFVVPESVQKLRELEIEGKKRALQLASTSQGYWNSVDEIMKGAARAGVTLTFEEARSLFENQRAMDVLEATKPGMTFIAPGINEALGAMLASRGGSK